MTHNHPKQDARRTEHDVTLPATRNKPKRSALADYELFGTLEAASAGGFRKARWKRCRHCNQLTLNGLDNDMCATRTTIDPTPLTRAQEAWAATHARRTFALDVINRSVTIWARDPLDIATPSRRPIVPTHVCGMRYAGFILRPPVDTRHDERTPPPF